VTRTRREFLSDALAAPIALSTVAAGPRILAGPDCLSQESAAGFRSVLPVSRTANLILLCSATMPPRLHAAAVNGAWIVWEISPFASRNSFAITDSPGDLYVRYLWPHAALTRSFSRVIPVRCAEEEAIAHYRGRPVAMKRRIGRGGIVFLGSMLGPNLRSGEREARALAKAIFSEIASVDTSTAVSANT